MIAQNLTVLGSSRLLNKLYVSSGLDVTGNVNLHTGLCIDTYYQTGSGQLILKAASNYNAIIRNDGNYTYFLLSSANNSYTYNDLRPLYINNTTGKVVMGNGLSIAAGTFSVASTSTFTGKTTHNGGITVNGTTSTTSLTASTGLFTNLQVLDTLRTTKWSLDNVASLGGHFYVSPTLFFSSSTTATISAISGTTVTMAIKDSNSIKSNSAGGVTWPSGAKVKLSGRLGNVALGTCTGTLTTAMNATAGTITLTFTFDNASSLSVKAYAASEIHNLAIMMYNNGTYPVGIAMTSYGTNGYSYIDIYGGSTAANNPNVRIGKLDGLPAINGTSPTGWGIYTNNGFFSGTIVSTAGKIGGYTLSTYNLIGNNVGISSQSGYEFAFWAGSNTSSSAPFRVGHEGTLYCTQLSATGGTIGSFKINGEYLCSNPDKVGMSATNANWAFYAGYDSSTGKAPFQVKNDGTLICSNIQATGGTIGGCSITNGKLTVPAANISGTLTASQIQVGVGGNLYPNYDTFTNITSSTISYLKNSTATVSLDTSVTYYGKKSLKIVSSGTDSYVYLGHSSNNYGCIKVIANKVYRISCYAVSTSSASCELYVVGHTAINSTNSAHSVKSATVGTSWTRIEFSYTASSSYPYISLRVDVNTNGATVYFDAFQIEEVSSTSQVASPFKPSGSTMIDGGNIYTGTITALGAVTAGSFYLGNGKFQVASDGTLTCTGAKISGDVTATAFKLGSTSISITSPSIDMVYWTWDGSIVTNLESFNSIYTNALTLTSTHLYTNANVVAGGSIYSPRMSTTDLSSSSLCSKYIYSNEITAGKKISISGATNATMTSASTNPQIVFSENGTQPVHLIYTDYDTYRSPAGLKVVGGTSATPAWFEVEGEIISNTWRSQTYGGGWYMSDTTWIRSYGSKNIYQNSGILRTDGTLQVGADGAYFKASSSGTNVGGKLLVTYSGVGGVTIQGTGTTTGLQITRTDTNHGLRVGMSSSDTQGIWACDYNTSESTAIIYRKPSDASATTYLPGRLVMAGAYGTSAPPTTGTLVKGMVYFQIVS